MTAWAEDLLLGGGYVLLAALILLENLFPPVPSELLLPLAGSRVASGDFGYLGAVAAATGGSVTGARSSTCSGASAAGRCCCARPDPAARRAPPGPRRRLVRRTRPRARAARPPRPRGTQRRLRARRAQRDAGRGFLALTALGGATWNAPLIGAGWALGSRWREATELVGRADDWAYVAVVAAAAAAYGAPRVRRARSDP